MPLSTPEPKCDMRQHALPHCWHTHGTPYQSAQDLMFPAICCFCAPSYLQITVYVHPQVTEERLAELRVKHGRLIVVKRREVQRGPSILVPSN